MSELDIRAKGPTPPPYGLWDTVEKVWLGNEAGPLLYDPKDEQESMMSSWIRAKLAATVMCQRLGDNIGGKVLPRTFEGPVKYKDVITPKYGAVDAIEIIEGGL